MSDLPKIKFNKQYLKLPKNANGMTAKLLLAHKTTLEKQNKWFLEYDSTAKDGSHYSFPEKGDELLLVFEAEDGSIFTTLRSSNPRKDGYYQSCVGKLLELLVE